MLILKRTVSGPPEAGMSRKLSLENEGRSGFSVLGIERKPPLKAAAATAKFGGKFPCNLRWGGKESPNRVSEGNLSNW